MLASDPETHNFTLLRHGLSEGNVKGLFQGREDYPLTEIGRAQARQLGEYWLAAGVRFDHLISSPLSRARETAEIIAAIMGLPLEFDLRWMEQDFGKLSNWRVEDYHQSGNRPDMRSPYQKEGETGESLMEVYQRAFMAMNDLLYMPQGSYLIVSHGNTLNMALFAMFGVVPLANGQGPRFPHGNTHFTNLSYSPGNHRWHLLGLNQAPHLSESALQLRKKPDYEFAFVRHAESEGNAAGLWQCQSDFQLTTAGLEQANLLAKQLEREKVTFDRIITSPLQRTRQTAEAVQATLGISLEHDPIWLERDNGKYAGLTMEDALQRYPPPPFLHLYHPVGIDGETSWELYLRAGEALHLLMANPPGKYLVVSHGGLMNMLIYNILGIPPQADHMGPRFRLQNSSMSKLYYYMDSHRWFLMSMNDRSHLLKEKPHD